jgi:hypothetical protein
LEAAEIVNDAHRLPILFPHEAAVLADSLRLEEGNELSAESGLEHTRHDQDRCRGRSPSIERRP